MNQTYMEFPIDTATASELFNPRPQRHDASSHDDTGQDLASMPVPQEETTTYHPSVIAMASHLIARLEKEHVQSILGLKLM